MHRIFGVFLFSFMALAITVPHLSAQDAGSDMKVGDSGSLTGLPRTFVQRNMPGVASAFPDSIASDSGIASYSQNGTILPTIPEFRPEKNLSTPSPMQKKDGACDFLAAIIPPIYDPRYPPKVLMKPYDPDSPPSVCPAQTP